MMRKAGRLILAALLTVGTFGAAWSMSNLKENTPSRGVKQVREILLAQRRSCQTASTCREAVEMWCGGYRRADGDGDGIPCENVCRSKSEVDKIKDEIAC
jgi:hypothetical protein